MLLWYCQQKMGLLLKSFQSSFELSSSKKSLQNPRKSKLKSMYFKILSSLLPDEIEGMYMYGSINEEAFSGSIRATTIVEEGDFVMATNHQLAQWNGELQESCE